MILLWKGRGWLVLLIGLASIALSMQCAEQFVMMANFENDTLIQIGIALIYAGVFIRTFFVLFPAKKNRHFIDAQTGEEVFIDNVDSLYYLDVKYWAYGLLVIGLVLFGFGFGAAMLS